MTLESVSVLRIAEGALDAAAACLVNPQVEKQGVFGHLLAIPVWRVTAANSRKN